MFIYDFVENLFKKLCTRFHKNRPSVIEDITENIFGLFFPDAVYYLDMMWVTTT